MLWFCIDLYDLSCNGLFINFKQQNNWQVVLLTKICSVNLCHWDLNSTVKITDIQFCDLSYNFLERMIGSSSIDRMVHT